MGRGSCWLPDHLVGSRADSGAGWQQQMHCPQVPHHAACRADFPKFFKDQPDARLHFFVRVQDDFSSRSTSQAHGQSLLQFSSFGFVSCSSLHPLFELVQFSLAHHARQAQQ